MSNKLNVTEDKFVIEQLFDYRITYWLGPNEGYTHDIKEAYHYSNEEAKQILRSVTGCKVVFVNRPNQLTLSFD